MLFQVEFADGSKVDVDTLEFGPDGMGEILDHLVGKHGSIIKILTK